MSIGPRPPPVPVIGDDTREFYASAAGGTEHVLVDELRELGLASARKLGAGARFDGRWEDGWRACLHSRIAQRIMTPLARFPAADPVALYDGAHGVDWSPYITHKHTFAVAGFSHDSQMHHSGFVALKVKDALVDHLRERFDDRPRVDRENPDVRVFVHLERDLATLYLDLAGEPLFKRGYRKEAGEAPLKETLAAAILRLIGWDRHTPLLDPCCGSGTLPTEAALWAKGVAPGIFRPSFGFERWANFDAEAKARMSEIRGAARAAAHGQLPRIRGQDADPAIIEVAKANARAAGLRLSWQAQPMRQLQAQEPPSLVVANPPYGHRLEADTALIREVTSAVCRMHGHRVALLAGSPELAQAIPLKPSSTHALYNGDLRCLLMVFDVP